MRLLSDQAQTGFYFEKWLEALKAGAIDEEWGWFMPDVRLAFRLLRATPPTRRRVEFSAGSSAESAIVQINEPATAGSENPLAGIAIDEKERHYLVRQAELHENNVSPRIKNEEFSSRTGLLPVPMLLAKGRAKRQWHVVTALDDIEPSEIRQRTADFVDRCWTARIWGDEATRDERRIADLLGNPERGGSTIFLPNADPREVQRKQGAVWQKLFKILESHDIVMQKPRHARGFEVDAEILAPGRSLLVEIKTDITPSDIYTGTGQLMLYPVLLPNLAEHRRILLLPGKPSEALERALQDVGVELWAFEMKQNGREISATFSPGFLALCGAPAG